MKVLAYQISPNLRIEGDKVVSYSTVVARIKGNKLLVNGKYSRTTSKHICTVRHLMNLQIENVSEDKKAFYKYEFGANCSKPDALSPSVSTRILHGVHRGGKSLMEATLDLEEMPKKDWAKIKAHLGIEFEWEPPHKREMRWHTIGTQL